MNKTLLKYVIAILVIVIIFVGEILVRKHRNTEYDEIFSFHVSRNYIKIDTLHGITWAEDTILVYYYYYGLDSAVLKYYTTDEIYVEWKKR